MFFASSRCLMLSSSKFCKNISAITGGTHGDTLFGLKDSLLEREVVL